MPQNAPPPEPWWSNGLGFACQRCGSCCTGRPGTVRVTAPEIAALARRLGFDERELRRRFTRPLADGERGLVDDGRGACIFYSSRAGCLVYEDRPRQCRTWPFWRAVVATPERWAEEARSCPGMNHGPRHDAPAIAAMIADDGTSGRVP